MILSLEQITTLIEKPRASSLLEDAMAFQSKHRLHLLGEGFEKYLQRLEGLENDNQFSIRKSVAKPTTIRIFKQILNQFKKTFRASGFYRDYEFNDESLKEDFIEYLKDVGGGLSIQELMRVVWFKAVFEDFNGVFLIELPETQEEELAEPFPVFKGVDEIHDILIDGEKVEYIIFSWETQDKNRKKTKHYRVIDDLADYHFVKEGGGKLKLATKESVSDTGEVELVNDVIDNIWGYVPAIQPSKLNFSIDNDILKKSYIQEVMGNADNYLSISNGHSVSIKLHQHPLVAGFPVTCGSCNGQGYLINKEMEQNPCGTCNSTGKMDFMHKDPSKGITLPEPEVGESFEAKAPMIYITPELQSMSEQRIEMQMEESQIEKGVLGAEGILTRETKVETATGKEIDMQPVLDLLTDFSINGEEVESFITNTMGVARYNDGNETGTRYLGSTIKWGKKFFVKSASVIEKEYAQAKESGVPTSTLSEMLDELIHTKFENNPMLLKRSLILKELEPFPTFTAKEVKELGVNPIDLNIKIYFNDFIERFERENTDVVLFQTNMSFDKKLELINKALIKFAEEKMPEPEKISLQDNLSIEERVSRGLLTSDKARELRSNQSINN